MRLRVTILGATCGAIWMLIALAFDKGVQDFNYPVIPTDTTAKLAASWLAALVTGAMVASVFHPMLVSKSRRIFYALPLATLPTAITVFSALIWVVWLLSTEVVPPAYGFLNIFSIFIIYGMLSPFTLVLYGCALGTQWVIRDLVGEWL